MLVLDAYKRLPDEIVYKKEAKIFDPYSIIIPEYDLGIASQDVILNKPLQIAIKGKTISSYTVESMNKPTVQKTKTKKNTLLMLCK